MARLSKEELNNMMPQLIKILNTTSTHAPLTAKDIVLLMNQKRIEDGLFTKVFRDTHLRNISNYIRDNEILPLMANNKGYYISTDIAEIDAKIESFDSNIRAQERARDGLKRYKQQLLNQLEKEKELGIERDPFGFDWD